MAQDEGHAIGVEATVDRIQHRTRKWHAEVRLQHRRCIGCNDRNGVAPLDAPRNKRGSQPVASVSRLSPRLAQLAMDDGHAIGEYVCTSIQESERAERHMVGGRAIESARVGCLTHRWCLRCADRDRRGLSEFRQVVSTGRQPRRRRLHLTTVSWPVIPTCARRTGPSPNSDTTTHSKQRRAP